MMTTDIFIVTYQKDIEWFKLSLEILKKHLSGYRNIHVVLQDWKGSPPVPTEGVIWHNVKGWQGQGYMHQQYCKLLADQYTDADLIFHFDSDTFLKAPATVADFMVDEKPAWFWSWYTDLGDTVPWKVPTERATGLVCEREFMQATPFLIHRSTYQLARDLVERQHGPLDAYMRACSKKGRQSFSEFNVLGVAAYAQQPDLYAWIDRNRDEWPTGFKASRQFWSHAPIADHMNEIRRMLGEDAPQGSIRTTDMGIWIPSDDTHIGTWVEQHRRLDFDGYLLPRIIELIKPGDVVVDVGANIGDHAWGYAKAVIGEDSGRVLAFEPNPIAFECLRRNMAGHGHVECINKGLSSNPGRAAMVQNQNVGASHMVAGDEVDITTMDSYGLEKCELIKIDAEGYEFNILQGAWQTITRCRPILVLEINRGALERNGVYPEDIYSWLKLRGYRLEGHEPGPQFDIFAFPE